MKTSLSESIESFASRCVGCGLCVRTCRFLQEHGSPGEIAETVREQGESKLDMTYECNLCQLCTAVCPKGLDPAGMFLEMRREAVRLGHGLHRKHRGNPGL